MSSKEKILIVRCSSIGDIVLCSPVILAIQEQWVNGAEVHFLTKKSFTSLIEHNPHITKVWAIEKSISELGNDFYNQKFDLIVDLHRNLRSLGLILRLRSPFTRLHKLNFQKWIYVRFGINLLPDIHVVHRYLNTVQKWGIQTYTNPKVVSTYGGGTSPKTPPVERSLKSSSIDAETRMGVVV